MNKAAEQVYKTILADGDQRAVVESMQTREELYEYLNYHEYERKLDQLLAEDGHHSGLPMRVLTRPIHVAVSKNHRLKGVGFLIKPQVLFHAPFGYTIRTHRPAGMILRCRILFLIPV